MSTIQSIYQAQYRSLVEQRDRYAFYLEETDRQIILLRQEAKLANVELACPA